MNTTSATAFVDEAVRKFPRTSSHALSRMLFAQHPLEFMSADAARCLIRYRRGAKGARCRGMLSSRTKFETPENPLNLPPSDEQPWKAFDFTGASKVLVISDLHLPYHNMQALTCALKDGRKHKCDGVFINGDLMDFHRLSRFEHSPKARSFKEERKMGKEFLKRLRELYPKARIVFKEGNHDERMIKFVLSKAAELYDEDIFSLSHLLDLPAYGVEHVTDKKEVMLGRLPVLHGHEFDRGFAPPVNPARGAFLKAKECVMVSHHHKTSEHTETSLGRKIITTWSLGCLCELRPAYSPYNSWNHGHAIVELHKGDFHVMNKRQLNGVIL